MRFKPKTVRRLKLLSVVTILIVGGAFALFVVRHWQTTRTTERLRRDGMAALASGRYATALDQLARYLHRGRTEDAAAWLAFAKARAKLEEPDSSHLVAAISAYQQYLDHEPNDTEARLALLKLCNRMGKFVEARDAADRLLPQDLANAGPEHVEVLRQDAIALAADKKYGPRLDSIVDRLLQLAPLDLQGQLLRLEVLGRAGRKNEARDAARRLLAEHPDDPVAHVISATSLLLEPTPEEFAKAREQLAHAVGLDNASGGRDFKFPSAGFAAHVADIFDRLLAFDLSLRLITNWHSQLEGPLQDEDEKLLERTLARRLWQSGDLKGIRACFGEGPGGARRSWADVDSEVLAFVALSSQVSDPSLVPALLQQLNARPDDFRARAWAAVIPLADRARTPDPKNDSETLKLAVKATSRREPVFMVMLGESLAALARTDEARELWHDAANLPVAVGWPLPNLRIAETLLSEGRAAEAANAATEALRASPDSPQLNAVWFETQAAWIQRGGTGAPEAKSILRQLERAIAQVEAAKPTPEVRAVWERLLGPHVLLIANTGERERAIQVVRAAINGEPPLSTATLQRLASISRSERLGVEGECLSRASAGGAGGSAVAFDQAVQLARAGKRDEGLQLVRAAVKPGDAESALAVARYMERTGHPEALKAWTSLGDEFKSDVGVQRACLLSPAACADNAFIERTIERYKALSGREPTAEDAIVRTARARVLLRGTPTSKDRDAAIALLGPTITAQPKLVEPRLVLAAALQMSDPARGIRPELDRAGTQLAEALALEPRSAPIALELAQVFQLQAQFSRSRELLGRVASDTLGEPELRLSAAKMLVAQGEPAPIALQTLSDLDKQWGAASPQDLLSTIAFAYEQVRQDDSASAAYARLIAHPDVGPDALFAAAKFFQARSLSDRVDSALAQADRLGPGFKSDLQARLADALGNAPESIRFFEAAVTAAPSNAVFWRNYAASLLARSDAASAQKCAERGLQAVPGDSSLALLIEQARLASTAPGASPDLQPLIAALSRDRALSSAAEIIKAIDTAQQRGDFERPEAILALAETAPTVPMLQVYLAQRMASLDPEASVTLANRAAALAPGNPVVLRQVAELLLNLNRWRELRTVATSWRAADSSRTPDADVAIAQACLNLKDFPAGLAALKPWAAAAQANPKSPGSLSVLNINARLLMASGREPEARAFLQPALAGSSEVRAAIWLRTAAELAPSVDAARSWIETVRPMIPADAVDEQLALAGAWSVLASRFPGQAPTILAATREQLTTLTQSHQTAPALEALGVVCHRLNDYPAAEQAYQQALAIDPKLPTALNNLATILLEVKHDPAAALAPAARAAELAPSAASLGTLGSVQLALADASRSAGDAAATSLYKSAADTYHRLANALRRDPDAWQRAAEASTRAGDFVGAELAWGRLTEIPGLPGPVIATCKNNRAMAILQQEPGKEQLDRARGLVNEAILTSDQPAFRDSLGWVELQANRRAQAIAAFRSAMQGADPKQPHLKSSAIGLATALAAGSAEERKEAAILLKGIDVKDLDANLAAKFRRVHSLVDADKP